MRYDSYFGKSERDAFGDLITKCCKGWIISKRIYHCDAGEEFSLQGVADLLAERYPDYCSGTYVVKFGNDEQIEEFSLFTILGALEGMCNNNEAVEVADGFYYVGSYSDWENDIEAQNNLDDILSNEESLY